MFTSRFQKGPPPTLQILFRGTLVAELSKKKKQNGQPVYTFKYLPAFKQEKLAALPGLSFSDSPLESSELWPYFAERIPDARRPEIQVLMKTLKLSEYDDIRLLAALGAHSITDPFEIRLAA